MNGQIDKNKIIYFRLVGALGLNIWKRRVLDVEVFTDISSLTIFKETDSGIGRYIPRISERCVIGKVRNNGPQCL